MATITAYYKQRFIWKTNYNLYFNFTKNDEFAAVTVPCGFIKAGFNLANLSIGDTLIPLSFSITFEVFGTKQ